MVQVVAGAESQWWTRLMILNVATTVPADTFPDVHLLFSLKGRASLGFFLYLFHWRRMCFTRLQEASPLGTQGAPFQKQLPLSQKDVWSAAFFQFPLCQLFCVLFSLSWQPFCGGSYCCFSRFQKCPQAWGPVVQTVLEKKGFQRETC